MTTNSKWKVIGLIVIGVAVFIAAPIMFSSSSDGQDFTPTRALEPQAVSPVLPVDVAEMGGGGGCGGCGCCFPKTPDKIIDLNGYHDLTLGNEVTVFTAPMMEWLIVSNLDIHITGAPGVDPRDLDINVWLEEKDMLGNRVQKRCADLAPFNARYGIPIKPGTTVMLTAVDKATGNVARGFYWHLNGYLWMDM